MQLHRLSLCAIGPFADRCEVDLEQLGASGIFLLEGPTGAGKSTLIDAIVFAIYGDVAGRASSADRMHSDVADADVTPFVELDFSTAQGMYRIRRTPKHERAKRRGEGMMTENASAKLWQLVSPGATDLGEPVSTRLEEVGGEISRIVGLTQEQFVQTVVLPQGEFATFLRAAPEARRELLQRLFGTEIYDVVLERLVAQRRAARQSRVDAAAEVAGSVRAYCGAAGLDEAAEAALVEKSAEELTQETAKQGAQLRADVEIATATAAAAASAVDAARKEAAKQLALERTRQRVVALRKELAGLDAVADQRQADQDRLALSAEALRLVPVLEGMAAADQRHREAVAALAIERAKLSDAEAEPDVWPQRERLLRARAAELSALSELEQALVARTEALTALIAGRDELVRQRRDADEAVVLGPTVLAELRQQLTAAMTLRGDRSAAPDERRAAEEILAAASELDSLQVRAAEVAATREAARQLAKQRLAEETEVRRRFLDGVAGYIASGLVASEPCPVCGSREHPRPAVRQPGDVTRADVEAAGTQMADATAALDVVSAQMGEVESMLGELRGRAASVSVAQAQVLLMNADLAVADLDIATRDVERLQAEIIVREKSLEEHRAASEVLAGEATRLQSEVSTAEAALEADGRRIIAALEGHHSIAERMASLAADADSFQAAFDASRVADAAAADLATRAAEWSSMLAPSPFATGDEVVAAQLADAERTSITARVEAAERRRAELTGELSGPEYVDVDIDAVIDVGQAEAEVARAETVQLGAQERLARLGQRWEDCQLRAVDVDRALSLAVDIDRSTASVIRMADLVSGSTADNARSMSLPTFVLRERFADVVASANERLAMMSDGRYALEHVEDREGNKRSGLGLRVRDTHTEQPRDPGTLSGGETFYCSLAMALGLADVVTAEAGGIDLGTLFVDEGFGSLDVDTLDNVLSVLSRLGTSGRVVGIVSHVPELKERISERITVIPNRDGSSRLVVSA